MDKVLIVSKTTNGTNTFLGGVNLDKCQNVQLGPDYVGYAHPKDIPMNVGEVWNCELGLPSDMTLLPPHIENQNMMFKERTDQCFSPAEMRELVINSVGAPFVQPYELYDGLIEFNRNGKGYVDASGSLPSYSVGFWRIHESLELDYDNKENEDGTYYRSKSGDFRVKYTGLAKPERQLRPGTLLRFFLSQPREFAGRDVFWLVLSGWFL